MARATTRHPCGLDLGVCSRTHAAIFDLMQESQHTSAWTYPHPGRAPGSRTQDGVLVCLCGPRQVGMTTASGPATASRSTLTSRFRRSSSVSGMRLVGHQGHACGTALPRSAIGLSQQVDWSSLPDPIRHITAGHDDRKKEIEEDGFTHDTDHRPSGGSSRGSSRGSSGIFGDLPARE